MVVVADWASGFRNIISVAVVPSADESGDRPVAVAADFELPPVFEGDVLVLQNVEADYHVGTRFDFDQKSCGKVDCRWCADGDFSVPDGGDGAGHVVVKYHGVSP